MPQKRSERVDHEGKILLEESDEIIKRGSISQQTIFGKLEQQLPFSALKLEKPLPLDIMGVVFPSL
jgi:hypothetical protein